MDQTVVLDLSENEHAKATLVRYNTHNDVHSLLPGIGKWVDNSEPLAPRSDALKYATYVNRSQIYIYTYVYIYL